MARVIWTGFCLAALACTGCGGGSNEIAVPPGDMQPISKTPPPEKSAKGKPSFSNRVE